MEAKFKGCLLGAAVGDALGMQTEGLSPAEVSKLGWIRDYGTGSLNPKLRPGQYTDDTQQTLLLAESLAEKGRLDMDHYASKLKKWGLKLRENPELDRMTGRTSLEAIERLLGGVSWQESGGERASCGAAMRVAPVGMLYWQDLQLAGEMAALSALPTHSSPAARAGAAAVAVGVAAALQGKNASEIVRAASSAASRWDKPLADRIRFAWKLKDFDSRTALERIGASPLVWEAVPAAFYCLAHSPRSFSGVVLAAVNFGDDSDSVASMAGAISGALLGVGAIPARWLAGLEDHDEIERIAVRLWQLSQRLQV